MKLVVSAALAAVLLSGCAAKNAAESVVGGVGSVVGGVAGGAVGAAGAVVGGVGNAVGGVVDAVVDPSDANAPEMAAAEGGAMAADDAMSMGSPAEEPMVEAPTAAEPVAEEAPVTLEEFCAANDFALEYIPDSDGGDDHKFCLDDGGVMVLEDNLQQYIASRAAQG